MILEDFDTNTVQSCTATMKLTDCEGHAASVQRKAMKDLALSDGTFIPKRTVLTYVFHQDSAGYDNPGVFNSFWFS
ncbi:hypothetical protein EDD16DRAFT_1675648 [Pisolithus croceorrhizus]|nr:hypothetical protein EDD16DRAFT_1675648 [Pisolithus croceorrhizus]KAI6103235.1 hypothetical protein EV401DRAFT_2021233 [Pisolithus croceorrhizus]